MAGEVVRAHVEVFAANTGFLREWSVADGLDFDITLATGEMAVASAFCGC